MKEYFSKHMDDENGYTQKEAEAKKRKVDEAYGVGTPTSKWKPAVIEPDPNKNSGLRVVIETISKD